MIGSELVAKATPDGYTLLFGGLQTHAMNSAVIRNVPYDPVKDFTPVSQITRSNWMLAVNPSLGVTKPADLVSLLRANPDKYSYSSSGNGSAAHLGFAMLASELGVRVVHVPYKGIGQAIADTVSGQVQMVMSDQSTLLGHIRGGRLTAIAMTGNVRSPLQPEVPTIAETIVPGFDIQSWNGIWGPPGMPAALVKQINQTLVAATNAPETVERLKKGGSEPVGSTPEAFGELVRREVQRWVDSAKKANITPE
jgi:tripartite-type tricarboxylate transporter receptor subunit TctC